MSNSSSYVCCEHYDFLWDERSLKKFRELWKKGWSIGEIARYFKRDPQEVLFLAIDQYDYRKIRARDGGVWGRDLGA